MNALCSYLPLPIMHSAALLGFLQRYLPSKQRLKTVQQGHVSERNAHAATEAGMFTPISSLERLHGTERMT